MLWNWKVRYWGPDDSSVRNSSVMISSVRNDSVTWTLCMREWRGCCLLSSGFSSSFGSYYLLHRNLVYFCILLQPKAIYKSCSSPCEWVGSFYFRIFQITRFNFTLINLISYTHPLTKLQIFFLKPVWLIPRLTFCQQNMKILSWLEKLLLGL